MNISENALENLFKHHDTVYALYLNNCKILRFTIHSYIFANIQFLSLKNNQIKNINFLTSFTKLWYLNLKNNYIENFDVFNEVNCLGYLGVSLNKFTEQNFFKNKKFNLGILEIDGKIEDLLRFNMFVYNSTNNFLKVNDEIILFCDKFRIFPESMGDILSTYTSNKIKFMKQKTFSHTLRRGSEVVDYIKNFALKKEFKINNLISTIDLKSYFGEYKNEVIKVLEVLFRKKAKTISYDNQTFLSTGKKRNIKPKGRFEIKEYLDIERKKLITLNKVYQTILNFNKNKSDIIYFNKDGCIKFIDFSFLFINEEIVLSLVLNILLLFIVSVINSNFAIQLLKVVLITDSNLEMLHNILLLDRGYLIGLYFILYDHYKNLTNSFITEEGEVNVKKKISLKMLKMKSLILKVNLLHDTDQQLENLFSTENDFNQRKHLIKSILIKYLDQELNILDDVIIITQKIFDYLIMNKLDRTLFEKVPDMYKVFLEIRSCFLSHFEKKLFENEYHSHTDRLLNDYASTQIGTGLYFLKNHENVKDGKNIDLRSVRRKIEFDNISKEKVSVNTMNCFEMNNTLRPVQNFLRTPIKDNSNKSYSQTETFFKSKNSFFNSHKSKNKNKFVTPNVAHFKKIKTSKHSDLKSFKNDL